jgi:hypothetical protein
MQKELTPIEWLEEKINGMISNGADFGDDQPALMEHIKKAKEMERQNSQKSTPESFWKRFDKAWDDTDNWGGEYGEGV